MVEAALTTPAPGYAVLYGISRNTRSWWDLAPGRALGYEPQDDAEDCADRIAAAPEDDGARAPTSAGRSSTEAFGRPGARPGLMPWPLSSPYLERP